MSVLGGEVEGTGMMAAAQRHTAPCIVIKGISDFGQQKAQPIQTQMQSLNATQSLSLSLHSLSSSISSSSDSDIILMDEDKLDVTTTNQRRASYAAFSFYRTR